MMKRLTMCASVPFAETKSENYKIICQTAPSLSRRVINNGIVV